METDKRNQKNVDSSFGRTRVQFLGCHIAYKSGQQPKNRERGVVGRVGRYLKKQASGAGVVRVGSGQGWILLREAFISMAGRILFPDCHYTPNDSRRQVAHRRAACAARRHPSPCYQSANSFIRVFPAAHRVTSEYPPHASKLTCWYLTKSPKSRRCSTGESGAHQAQHARRTTCSHAQCCTAAHPYQCDWLVPLHNSEAKLL